MKATFKVLLYFLWTLLPRSSVQFHPEDQVCKGDGSTCIYTSAPAEWEEAEAQCKQQGGELPDDSLMEDPAFMDAMKFRRTWTASRTGEDKCMFYKSDKNGKLRRKPADCMTKKPYMCLFPRKTISGECPSNSWIDCPKSKIAVELGSNLTLRCSHVEPFDECEWRLKGWIYRSSLLAFPSDPKVTARNGHICELNIPVVEEEHLGLWNCQGPQHDYLNVTLMEYKPPSPPLIRINDVLAGEVEIPEYSKANASCEGTGATNITMRLEKFGETMALATSEVIEKEGDEGRVVVRSVLPSGLQLRRFHEGALVCTLHHLKGKLTQTSLINVLYAPEMENRDNVLWGELGKGFFHVFTFSANPISDEDVYLNINTPSQEDGRLHPEEQMDNYQLGPVLSVGDMYAVELVVDSFNWNNTLYNHTLVLKNQLGRLETTFTIKPKSLETNRPEARKEEIPQEEEETSTNAGAAAAGVFCILIFLVGASALVYLFFHQRRKAKQQQNENEEKDPHSASTPLTTSVNGNRDINRKDFHLRSGSATDDELYTVISENGHHGGA